MQRRPFLPLLLTLVVGTFLVAVIGASVGAANLSVADVFRVILARLGFIDDADPVAEAILVGLRFPRVLLALAAGAALALSGALFQSSLRNRLAEPLTTGTAAGALLGASLFLLIGPLGRAHLVDGPSDWTVYLGRFALAAFLAVGATFLVVRVANTAGRVAAGPLLLGGLAVNALVGALAAGILFLGSIGQQTAATVVTAWMFGGLLTTATFSTALAVLLLAVVLGVLASRRFRELDLMLLGDEEARTAGVAVDKVRRETLVVASIATAAAVAAVGILAFVGFLAPHFIGRWTGPQQRRIVPASMLVGASLLILCDAIGRLVAAPAELPAGVVTALLGAPLLLLLLARTLQEVNA